MSAVLEHDPQRQHKTETMHASMHDTLRNALDMVALWRRQGIRHASPGRGGAAWSA